MTQDSDEESLFDSDNDSDSDMEEDIPFSDLNHSDVEEDIPFSDFGISIDNLTMVLEYLGPSDVANLAISYPSQTMGNIAREAHHNRERNERIERF